MIRNKTTGFITAIISYRVFKIYSDCELKVIEGLNRKTANTVLCNDNTKRNEYCLANSILRKPSVTLGYIAPLVFRDFPLSYCTCQRYN